MSMNLQASVDGDSIFLYQTPSYITFMCLLDTDNEVKNELSGKKAIHALHLYMQWVQFLADGVFRTREQAVDAKNNISAHIEKITGLLETTRTIKVWWQ